MDRITRAHSKPVKYGPRCLSRAVALVNRQTVPFNLFKSVCDWPRQLINYVHRPHFGHLTALLIFGVPLPAHCIMSCLGFSALFVTFPVNF
jgi:hypothetical protein